jgi:hypothetical protein
MKVAAKNLVTPLSLAATSHFIFFFFFLSLRRR